MVGIVCLMAAVLALGCAPPAPSDTTLADDTSPETPDEAEFHPDGEVSVDSCRVAVVSISLRTVELLADLSLWNGLEKGQRVERVVITVDGEEKTQAVSVNMMPDEGARLLVPPFRAGRDIGANVLMVGVSVRGPLDVVLVEKEVEVMLPVAGIGEAVSGVGAGDGMTLVLSGWEESDTVLVGPCPPENGYYIHTAGADMKFIILEYRFQNDAEVSLETPYLPSGKGGITQLLTDAGASYDSWSLCGLEEGRHVRQANQAEIAASVGNSAAYERLAPGESIQGRIVFEVPAGESAVEADINGVFPLIMFQAL